MAEITERPISAADVATRVASPAAGAILTFLGVVRDHNDGRRVVGIEYHAYPSMALLQLQRIEEAIRARSPGVGIAIVHRTGALSVGEASVAIAVSSPHRAEGFEALRFAIEEIKRTVPVWKKEIYADGHAWIEGA